MPASTTGVPDDCVGPQAATRRANEKCRFMEHLARHNSISTGTGAASRTEVRFTLRNQRGNSGSSPLRMGGRRLPPRRLSAGTGDLTTLASWNTPRLALARSPAVCGAPLPVGAERYPFALAGGPVQMP